MLQLKWTANTHKMNIKDCVEKGKTIEYQSQH